MHGVLGVLHAQKNKQHSRKGPAKKVPKWDIDVGINDGDLLVVDKSLKPKNFSTVIANVHDELVVKSLVQERDKKFLTSGSKEFTDRILINEEQDIFIWGVVTYVIHSTY